MENDANPESRVIQITYWQADGVQRLLTAYAHCFIGLMEDGRTVLKYPFHKNLDSLISLREEADRYARVLFQGWDGDEEFSRQLETVVGNRVVRFDRLVAEGAEELVGIPMVASVAVGSKK